jgi:hypothetical protein
MTTPYELQTSDPEIHIRRARVLRARYVALLMRRAFANAAKLLRRRMAAELEQNRPQIHAAAR